jgi:hypothetical protein
MSVDFTSFILLVFYTALLEIILQPVSTTKYILARIEILLRVINNINSIFIDYALTPQSKRQSQSNHEQQKETKQRDTQKGKTKHGNFYHSNSNNNSSNAIYKYSFRMRLIF